jgi:hypothetical protein
MNLNEIAVEIEVYNGNTLQKKFLCPSCLISEALAGYSYIDPMRIVVRDLRTLQEVSYNFADKENNRKYVDLLNS